MSLPPLAPTAPLPTAMFPDALPTGGKCCPSCGRVFEADRTDPYCECGTELVDDLPFAPMMDGDPGLLEPVVAEPQVPERFEVEPSEYEPARPPAGTACLVLYGEDRHRRQWFPLSKDATLMGRLDALKGVFPEIDLEEWLTAEQIKKISRQHAVILRSRAHNTFALRPLAGNTGTQLETQMLTPLKDYPLLAGHRIILGGVARFKFEIA
jgi:hypothetical protein